MSDHAGGSVGDRIRVWLLTNAPSPYQVEYLRALQGSDDIELAVRFMRSGYSGMAWSAPTELPDGFEIMSALGGESRRDEFRFHPSIFGELRSEHDVYVLSGLYTSPTFLAAAWYLHVRKENWAMWLEQPWPDDYRPEWSTHASAKSGCVRGLRRRILRRLVSWAPRIFAIGGCAMDAYSGLGAREEQLVLMPYTCDVSRFQDPDGAQVDALKSRYGLNDKVTYLYSGLLNKRKGVDVLLGAFQCLAGEREDVSLVLLGDGPNRTEMESSIPSELRSRVHFTGRVGQEELPAFFGAADVFVFPSRHDGWAVVINEACAAGLPVIVTESTGAARDLVRNGENGYVVGRDDDDAFYEKMLFFAEHREEIERYGACSLEIMSEFTISKGVRRFEGAVRELSGGRSL